MTMEEKLKRLIKRPALIKDENALQSNVLLDSIDNVVHRDDEIDTMSDHLYKLMKGITPPNLFIYGSPGLGKTLVTTLLLKLMKKIANDEGHDFIYITISCTSTSSDISIMQYIVKEMQNELDLPNLKHPYSVDAQFKAFADLVNQYGGQVVLVFDDIHLMKNPDKIATFMRIKIDGFTNKNLCIIGISNNLSFEEKLSPRVISSLHKNDMLFLQYDAIQLKDILLDRAVRGLHRNCYDEEILALCAAIAAQDHGDARKAIDLLAAAVSSAENKGNSTISTNDVDIARHNIELDTILTSVSKMPTQPKIVLYSIILRKQQGFNTTSTIELYDLYKQIAVFAGIDLLSQRRVSDISSELAELGIIVATVGSKGVRGRTRKISINQSPEPIKEIIEQDQYLDDIHKFKPVQQQQPLI